MNALQALRERLLTLQVPAYIREAAEDSRTVIEDMNAEQLLQGHRADGSEITPKYRNPLYAAAKQHRNSKPKPGTPDLKNTGAFHQGITARIDGAGITLEGTEQKTEMLQGKYGDDIIGLSAENIEELKTGYIGPAVADKVFKHLLSWRSL